MQLAPRPASRLSRSAPHPSHRGLSLSPVLDQVPTLDLPLLLAVLVLGGLGLLNLVALGDPAQAAHQALAVAVGLGAMLWAWRRRQDDWRWLGRGLYLLSLALLLGVSLLGAHAFGARRWLELGSVIFQPSELAELGLLLVLAEVMARSDWSDWRRLAAALVLALPLIGLTLLEPDLSTAALLAVILASGLVLGRIRLRLLGGLGLATLALLPLGLHLLRPYQLARLQGYLGHGAASGASWTLLQSHIAIASGGILGAGHSTLARLLATYLPARETDLAFSSVVERFGLLGGGLALLAVAVLVWRLASASARARPAQGALLAGMLAVLVGSEVVLSVGGNLGELPLAGVPIPLLSYGGTATVAHLVALGAVMGLRRDWRQRRLWRLPAGLRRRPRLLRALALGLALGLVLLGGLTYRLQHQQGPQLRQAALTEVTRWIPLAPVRGAIEDRHGTVLAESVPNDRILAVSSLLQGHPRDRVRLARLLGQSGAQLRRELARTPRGGGYTVPLGELGLAAGSLVARARLPGVVVERSTRRVYPFGALLGPLLGYTGVQTPAQVRSLRLLPQGATLGQAGLESEYDATLRGAYGSLGVLVSPAGAPVALGRRVAARNGGNLVTTLDLPLQQYVTAQLQTAVSGAFSGSQKGDEGAAVVMDAQNGQILAMASVPGYDDSVFGPPVDESALAAAGAAPGNPMLEHSTQTAMPPGSTFKLVVAAADAEDPVVSPTEVVPTGGSWTYDGVTFDSWADLPAQDLPQAIAWSNDVYFYKLAVALGPQAIIEAAHQLGVGQPTGIDLPGEYPGYLGSPATVGRLGQTWEPGDTAILGIGQGLITATPLQDARWTAAVSTGQLVTPRLGLLRQAAGGSLSAIPSPAPKELPFAQGLGPVQQGLQLAVSQGTATELAPLNIDAGGKTGTAQDPGAPNGGPDAWFTAVAPMSDPQVVVTLVVRGGGEGYYSSQPAVRNILQYFTAHESEILSSLTPQAQSSPAAPPRTATVTGTSLGPRR
ncbi:MAG: FtsW/RodA/SpoVE family cell cycle protein [Candidatus Dormibacteria bacterium]